MIRLELPARGAIRPNGPRDPLPYYYRASVGWLFRHRLQLGLDLIGPGRGPVLEVGVGSGVLVPTLTRHFPDYTGLDLALAPDLEQLVAPGCRARFVAGDLLAEGTLSAGSFELIVCFSVLEHIAPAERAAEALARLLAPGGTLLAGYPMVNRLMTRAFEAIGCADIDDDHVTTPREIAAALSSRLTAVARTAFPPRAPRRLALYQCTTWRKA